MRTPLLLFWSAFISATVMAGGSQTVTLTVSNMDCAACPITVRKALEKVPGVESAKVDFKPRTAVVAYDPAKATVQGLTKATGDAGYPSTLMKRQ